MCLIRRLLFYQWQSSQKNFRKFDVDSSFPVKINCDENLINAKNIKDQIISEFHSNEASGTSFSKKRRRQTFGHTLEKLNVQLNSHCFLFQVQLLKCKNGKSRCNKF